MSLDVFLYLENETTAKTFHYNITHNLGQMAGEAGVYKAMWRPYQLHPNFTDFEDDYLAEDKFEASVKMTAKDIIDKLEQGIKTLEKKPNHFKQLNPSNGWGNYEGLLKFAKEYLTACKEHPKAIIYTSR